MPQRNRKQAREIIDVDALGSPEVEREDDELSYHENQFEVDTDEEQSESESSDSSEPARASPAPGEETQQISTILQTEQKITLWTITTR